MRVVDITNEDIEKVEQKFGGLTFDEESREFIKCLESKDIKACPGAGKTTSLVAKLDILSNYMPFEDNSGILVLTHTNVAVDEIKSKLGTNAQKVLDYPNHVGTFQSFINKYLAIPMYIKIYGRRPERIDSEKFYLLFQKQFDSVTDFHRNWLETRAGEKYISVLGLIENLKLIDDDKLQYLGRTIISTNSSMFQAILTISKIPQNIRNNGNLTYNDCYDLALQYLNIYPQIIEIFQKRFKYVFIDEAQDTDDRQFEILNRLFSENSIVQKIGDNNQAIFNFSGQRSEGWNVSEDFIEIKNTKRFSSLISEQVIKVAIKPQALNGNEEITIRPTIILFDSPQDVLSTFGDLIIENRLDEKYLFKAVGAVGKEHDTKYTILDYFPTYQQTNNTQIYNTLVEKLDATNKTYPPREYKNIILSIFVDYLKEQNILNSEKKFTKNGILSFLREMDEKLYNDFKLKLFYIIEKLSRLECVIDEVKELLQIFLGLKNETFDEASLDNCIKNYHIEIDRKQSKQNIYEYSQDGIEFDIHVSTIHKVKGETHTATLVLETFNRGYDISQLLPLFKNKKKNGFKAKKRLIYVAMSRPTDFLCLAIHKDNVEDKDIGLLEDGGFRVVRC